MALALMVATPEERDALLPVLGAASVHHHAGREFHRGKVDGAALWVVCAAPDPVATATTAALLVEHFGADSLVSLGLATGLHTRAHTGDMVVARELRSCQLDAPFGPGARCAGWATDVRLSDALQVAAEAALAVERIALAESLAVAGIAKPFVHAGLVLSGERLVADATERVALQQAEPDALAIDRQGATLAQVCRDFDLPFTALRCVCNHLDRPGAWDPRRFVVEVAGPCLATVVRAWLHGPARPGA